MLLSLGLVLITGFLGGVLFEKIKLPKIVGMLVIGILLGPSVLNIIDDGLLSISAYLRQIALVIILTRSGLSLNVKNLKEIGRPAILMCFVPATFEIIGALIFAPLLLGVNIFEALLLGSVLAAVSPAIVVPRMIKLLNEGYNDSKIPELVMAGSSADDIYVIILFYAFLGLNKGATLDASLILNIPISIILGFGLGIVLGLLIAFLFKKTSISTTIKVLIMLGVSFLMIGIEELLKEYIALSALLGIVALGMMILLKNKDNAIQIADKYNDIWQFFEIFLFVLVGISVDINYALNAGIMPIIVLIIALLFRMVGVYVSLLFTKLNIKEKLFIFFSYIPKATVQASIGGIALANELECGELVLTMAVLSILITAPVGAILMDSTYKKLLSNTGNTKQLKE